MLKQRVARSFLWRGLQGDAAGEDGNNCIQAPAPRPAARKHCHGVPQRQRERGNTPKSRQFQFFQLVQLHSDQAVNRAPIKVATLHACSLHESESEICATKMKNGRSQVFRFETCACKIHDVQMSDFCRVVRLLCSRLESERIFLCQVLFCRCVVKFFASNSFWAALPCLSEVKWQCCETWREERIFKRLFSTIDACFPLLQVRADKAVIHDTVVFEGPPQVEQKLWPAHCVQGSWGSELHPELRVRATRSACVCVRGGGGDGSGQTLVCSIYFILGGKSHSKPAGLQFSQRTIRNRSCICLDLNLAAPIALCRARCRWRRTR